MNRLVKWLILANCLFVIPATLIVPPLIIESITNIYDTSTWPEAAQEASAKSITRWSNMMYIIPLLGTNLMIVFMYYLHGYNKPEPETQTKSDDPYANWTDEWREFQMKKDAMDKKNKEDSEAILRKYELMGDLK